MKFERVRNLREDHDLTQSQISNFLNVNRTTYAMWELGDVNIPLSKLVVLSEYFKTNLNYLLGLSDNKAYYPHTRVITKKELGSRLKDFRIQKGLTQRQMAVSIGINQSSYAYYEYGQTAISTEKLFYINRTFGLDIDELCK